MAIADEIRQELRDAMRAKDQRRLDCLRMVQTEISKAKAAPGFSGEVDDALCREVIGAYAKRMGKARDEYAGLGERGAEMADKLGFEIDYLRRWLPQKLDEAQTRALVDAVIEELGAAGPQAMGRVMGRLMQSHKDQLDGKLASRLVREALARR